MTTNDEVLSHLLPRFLQRTPNWSSCLHVISLKPTFYDRNENDLSTMHIGLGQPVPQGFKFLSLAFMIRSKALNMAHEGLWFLLASCLTLYTAGTNCVSLLHKSFCNQGTLVPWFLFSLTVLSTWILIMLPAISPSSLSLAFAKSASLYWVVSFACLFRQETCLCLIPCIRYSSWLTQFDQ